MYIIKNAWKSIIRNKGRNILMIIISLVIALSACVSLSIREAAVKAKNETLSSLTVKAQLSFDRTSMMSGMQEGSEKSNGKMNRGKFDFSSLRGSSLSMNDYMIYADLLDEDDSYYYNLSVSMNSTEDIIAYGKEETTEDVSMDDQFSGRGRKSGGKGMMMQASGDFSVTGYSDYTAMLSMFGNDGTYSITDGEMFSESGEEYECIISDELAMYNDLTVGDTVTLVNPDCTKETYRFTVTGIYTNSASDAGNSRFSFSDPANNIYMNAAALTKIISESAEASNTSDDDESVSAVLTAETSFTYVLASADNYYAFVEKSEKKGLPENYIISSGDLSAYEESISPLTTLGSMTGWFFVIVLIIGGIILAVLNIFNLRERKYEVGVLTAIGMKKSKVALQFVCELFIITFTALIIGTASGAAVSVPVTNSLLQSQIEKVQEADEETAQNFGMQGHGDRQSFSKGRFLNMNQKTEVSYIDSVSSATDFTVIAQLLLVGILLTIVSSLAALITIMRYEPLKILSSRS